jgi:hypothetical protein
MKKLFKWAAVLAMAALLPAATLAAEAPTSTRIMVTINHLKPGKTDQWRKAIQDTVVPAMKKAGVPSYSVSEQIFGERPVYTTIRPLPSFSELDGPGLLLRAGLTQKQVDAFNALADDSISSQQRFIANNQTEFSVPATGPATVTVLTVIRADPGQGGALRDLLRTSLLPAMRAAKQAGTIAGFGVSTTGQGNPGLTVVSVSYANLAGLDKGPQALDSMGPAGRELFFSRISQLGVVEDVIVNRRVADLSYAPAR